jgi:undecaprenyl-diphosphatase
MNGFDRVILQLFNHHALHSPALDLFAVKVTSNLLLKGGVVLAVIWALWFSRRGSASPAETNGHDPAIARRRRAILIGFAGTFIALALARGSSVMFPSRLRPVNYDTLFTIPNGVDTSANNFFVNDNSFPSDHAALFYALATTVFLVSRRNGVVMIAYVTVVIMFPRMYLLLHYPTDIFAGGIIGCACVILASLAGTATAIGRGLVNRVYGWSLAHAPSFYAAMFLWSFEIAELFDSVRRLAQIGPMLKALTSSH